MEQVEEVVAALEAGARLVLLHEPHRHWAIVPRGGYISEELSRDDLVEVEGLNPRQPVTFRIG